MTDNKLIVPDYVSNHPRWPQSPLATSHHFYTNGIDARDITLYIRAQRSIDILPASERSFLTALRKWRAEIYEQRT